MTSAAIAIGAPWKFPPDTMSPSAAKTIGLSVAALTSISIVAREAANAPRAAPCTCGAQRIEEASCTRAAVTRVVVLPAAAVLGRGVDRPLLHQPQQVVGRRALPRMRAGIVQTRL